MPVFVGCDLGTLGTKAAVVDESGEVLGEAFEEVRLSYPRPGCVEQDFYDIETSAHRTIRSALDASKRASDVAGVAFSGQMSGIGAIGGDYEPVTRYDSWLDTRCEPYIMRMAEHADRVTELSGCPPTYSHGPKILWWLNERPDDWKRIARFVVPGAFVAGRLCGLSGGDAFIDRTYLHFSNLSDTAAERWSEELLAAFGLDDRVLPRIVDPLDVVGEVTPDGAEKTGLPAGTPVAAGAGDQIAAALGAGVVSPGQAFDSAGTASVFAVCVDGFHPDVAGKTIMASHSVQPGRYIAFAFVNGGGLGLRWFRDELGPAAGESYGYRELDALAAETPPGSEGLLWFPHLQGRVLPPQPHARGAWIGLTSGHRLGHMYRALLEGIAYEYAEWAIRASGGSTRLQEARALGGGAASPLWNQIKADVLGIDWVPLVQQQCGVLGDALVAAVATGHVKDVGVVEEWQDTAEPIHPDPSRHQIYAGLLEAYRRLGPAIMPVFEQLSAARREE
ncbi:MAG: xylulose kinase [Streptosporangiales bacterium]|nr:xylulose kinase [Streptosporangiales bacterium]